MRITLETHSDSEPRRSPLTPKDQLEWVPLPQHPLFTATSGGGSGARNLLAWDGASRLYFWDSNNNFLHRLSLRLGDPDPTSVLAASPSKVLQADAVLNFDIQKISINRNGTAMLLFGSQGLCVMYLYGCTSKNDVNLICRTVTVGSNTYSNGINDIRLLQALWHPYSDTHLGILSSDSVFRLFNLAVDPLQPEQEYILRPVEPGRSRNASSVCPVDFSFGGDHLWDRFSVFISFSDGAIYVVCPLVPFGSLFKCESLLEIYNDARTFGLKSANSVAASNSKLAISWLEATFPELPNQETEGDSLSLLRAHAYALFDASLVLQGPLQRVGQGGNEDSVGRSAECEGHAVSFLYNLVGKDSILVTAWSGGQLQIDALADEIQPVWSVGSPPRLRVDSHDQIVGLTMICESIASGRLEELDHNAWLGNPPPLLRLAIVDLALPRRAESGYNISLCIDTLMPERIYSLNDGGVDSIVLHFLPFTSQTNGKDDAMRTPFVHPVLNTCQSGCTSEPSLCGFVSLSDSFGYSWIVAVTLSQECVVLEMKTWNLLFPLSIETEKKPIQSEGESKERDISTIISKELLSGPKEVLIPQASPSLRSVAADSIEGQSTLHQYFKLFHETYVEYAHEVYLELKHHAPQSKKIINYQHSRLGDAQQKLLEVEEKQSILQKRIDRAIQMHNSLEKRLQGLRNLPCAHKRPLSRAERQFKSELDHFREVELDALHSSVDALSARLRRHMQASKASHQQKISGKKICAGDDQISMFKSSLEKLSFIHDSPVTSRRSRTPSPPSPQRDSIPSQGIQTPIAEEISQAPSARFEGHFEPEVQLVNFDFPERDTCIETTRDATHPEDTQAVVQEHSSHQPGQDQLEADRPVAAETPTCPPEVIETVDDNGGDDENIGSLKEDDDEDDPLKLIEDILFGKTSIFSKSQHSTAHSEVEVQSISTTQLLQELAIVLNSGLDQLMVSEENKHKMITLLKQLGQHNQLLNPDVRQALQKLRGLFEYLMSNFCNFQQAITDHQQLLDVRAKLINDVTKAKGRRSKLHTALSTAQERLNQNEAKIVELKAQLQEIEEQQENLRAAVDKFTTQERQLKSNCSKWVVESKDVMLAIETSTPAFGKASTERKKAEETLRSLQFFFNHL